jgi:hypothetical protein
MLGPVLPAWQRLRTLTTNLSRGLSQGLDAVIDGVLQVKETVSDWPPRPMIRSCGRILFADSLQLLLQHFMTRLEQRCEAGLHSASTCTKGCM